MNKKGFTLVELLAVIAILAILVIMAVPNVINLFNDAKLRTFISETESLYKSVEQQVLAKQMKTTSANTYVFCSSVEESSLNLSGGDNLHYYITYVQGKMTSFFVENGTYLMYIDTTSGKGDIKISDLTKNTDGYYDYVYLLAPGKSINTCQAPSEDIKGEKVSIASNAVATNSVEEEKCETAVAFSSDSWETISCNVKNGNTSAYNLGDTKEVTLDGYGAHTLRIVNTSSPEECKTEGFSQSACGFVLEFTDIITTYNMNTNNTNKNGWSDTEMRTFINNNIYNSFENDLRNIIIDTTVISGYGINDSANFTSIDKLYLLDGKELYGSSFITDYNTANEYERQLDYYKEIKISNDKSKAIKEYNNTATFYFLRSASSNSSEYFFNVSTSGDWNYYYANRLGGVSVAFRIG